MSDPKLKTKLRRFRFDAGEMTQQALAESVGVSRQTIIAIESGRYAPSLPLAFRLAKSRLHGFENPVISWGANTFSNTLQGESATSDIRGNHP